LFAAYNRHPTFFTQRASKAKTVKPFRKDYSLALRDFNTAGVVAAHLGRPLSTMAQGYYQVHGTDVKVNSSQVTACENALDDLLAVIYTARAARLLKQSRSPGMTIPFEAVSGHS
jgi:hypothetical protein